MKGPFLIGVDIGTSGTKTAVFDVSGRLITQASVESTLLYPEPGAVEQDQMDFYASAVSTIRECIDKANIDPRQVAAIGIDGQMAGIGAIDESWNPVTMYDSWLDTRCERYIRFMNETVGDQVLSLTGCAPSYNHGPKMLWWKHEHPEVFGRIAKFVVPAAFAAGKMAGLRADEAFVDHTYLHFSGFADNVNGKWSRKLCDAFDFPMSKLPEIVEPWRIIGKLTRESAEKTGLLQGTPIVAGAGDTAAGLLGSAVAEVGIGIDVAGTASIMAACIPEFCPDLEHRTMSCARSVVPGLWYSYAYINGGGLCVRWFRDEFAKGECSQAQAAGRSAGQVYDILNAEAAAVKAGSDGLIFIPHLGGRVCPNQPSLRGTWHGFSWTHTRAHFYRAILEGVAYEYALYMQILKELQLAVEFSEIRVTGGGAKSSVWNQIKADVIGIPYSRLSRDEFSVLGSAMVAGRGVGLFNDVAQTAKSLVEGTERIEPNPDVRQRYDGMVRRYEDLMRVSLCQPTSIP
jgi:xylulokinase